VANDLSSRQWRLDTAVPFSAGPHSIVWHDAIWILNVEFSNYGGDTHKCVLKDRTGRLVWPANGSAGKQPVRSGELGWVNGLVLDELDSGLVIVYVK
jgi:hypothetical protein